MEHRIVITPIANENKFHLVDQNGNSLFLTYPGDEQDLAKLLASDSHWTVMEQFHDTYVVFNNVTFKYVVIYPKRKVSGEKMSTVDLITVTRIISTFTGLGFYLDVK